MHVVLCYPFLDLRFLIQDMPSPRWMDGARGFGTVGSLGKVMRGTGDGLEAEIRANAALAFGREYAQRTAWIEGDGEKKGRVRPVKSDPELGSGFQVRRRSLLAAGDGHVRLELIVEGASANDSDIETVLDSILTSPVYVVRQGSEELISAGFYVARLYLEQSAKTATARSEEIAAELLREGAGSPFVVVLHPGPAGASPGGTPVELKPGVFELVTCELMNLAGRTTGVWQIWGSGPESHWRHPMRQLCQIISQLSEVTSLLELEQDPTALAPHLLDAELRNRFFRKRSGQLRRPYHGPWPLQAVQPLAGQHLKVAIDEAVHSRESLARMLPRDIAGELSGTIRRINDEMIETPMLKHPDRERLATLLARQALGESDYFRRLIVQANLPPEFKMQKQQGWSSNPKVAAYDLIDWAWDKKTNPAEPTQATLASILVPELGVLGIEDRVTVVATIAAYKLVRRDAELADLQVRFHCPISLPLGEPVEPVGPDIDWHGPTDQLELQSWFAPEPPHYQEVAFLAQVMLNSASVCKVEIGATRTSGTGVLVHPRFVLTNHHVVAAVMTGEGVGPQAATIRLEFSAFEAGGPETYSVALDPERPIAAWSPTSQLDFALLRLSSDIDRVPNARPATIGTHEPQLKASLSILQHPLGSSMKLATSHNAIAYLDPVSGLIQYLTRTSRGSSGAPCFDDNWKLVAIHHAERARAFGTVREGILIGPIMQRIGEHLVA